MQPDSFFKPFSDIDRRLGSGPRPKSNDDVSGGSDGFQADASAASATGEDKPKPKSARLFNPKWETEKVGFNEESPISVELELPPEVAHKKRVTFELFARTPKGPERISQGEAMAEGGKATFKIPVYIPNFRDEDGNNLQRVEYYFIARHSEAEPLDGSKAPKVVDEMAERVIESHLLPDITFAVGSSFLYPEQAAELNALRKAIQGWKQKTSDGKLAVFGHSDAVGKESENKTVSERRARALIAFLTLDAAGYAGLGKEEGWKLDLHQSLLKHLGHDPGALDGQDAPKTQAAVKTFRNSQGLGENGGLDSAVKEKLYKAFFAQCNSSAVPAKDFDDVNGNAYAGCSEFNLAEKTNGPSAQNRRVGVFLLKTNKNFPIHYPCTKGDIGTCKKHVAKKGERRTAGFGCWFYDKLIVERPNQAVQAANEPISDLKWDVEVAWCGEIAKLTAQSNLADGTEVAINLATEDQPCEEAKAEIHDGKLEFVWKVRSVGFAFDGDGKALPEVEIFVEVTAQAKKYNARTNLKIKKLVEAQPETFDHEYTWGKYWVHANFIQGIQGSAQKVVVRKKALKTWGATYVDLSESGIKDAGGGFPWPGKRWARCREGEMWPKDYWDGVKWQPIPAEAMVDAGKFGTLPITRTGEIFHWVESESALWPGKMEDYSWQEYEAKRQAWLNDSNKRWTGVHWLKRKACEAPADRECCRYDLKLEFVLEETDRFHADVVCLAPGSLRSNAGLLFYGDKRTPMAAHEVGHLVGLPDEYEKGAVDPAVNGDGAKNGLDNTSLMGGNLSDPNNQIKLRHYANFVSMARLLAKNNGRKDEEWVAIKKAAPK